MSFFYSLLHAKLFPPADPTVSFAGKVVLVTGANCGLGFEAATKFVKLGATTVILACRNPKKGEAAAAAIEQRTGITGVLRSWELDMNIYASVQALATRVTDELPRLDVALLNAGVVQPHYRVSPEGWEETLQVNVLSSALLAMLLLPGMRANAATPSGKEAGQPTDQAHLCFVSSGNYEWASLPKQALEAPSLLQYFNQQDHFGGAEPQYNISKLFGMYAANQIAANSASREGGRNIIVNSVNPGATATSLTRNIDSLALRIVAFVYLRLLARTAEQGSRSLVSACALGPESNGQFWEHDHLPKRSLLVEGVEGKKLQSRVWDEIVDALKGKTSLVEAFL